MDRRKFIKISAATGTMLSASMGAGFALATRSQDPRDIMVMDAMGEIRETYSRDLLLKIIDSGLNAITVTLCDPKTFEEGAYEAAMAGVKSYDEYISANGDLLVKGTKVAQIDEAMSDGKLAIFYLFQNSTQFGRDLDRIDYFYDLGVRSSQITYNFQNWAGAGCKERTDAGLTYFGLALVEKMNEQQMLIDLSHANPATMAETIETSIAPVIISHTACMSVYENVRNTTDKNLKLLAEHGGVVGICQIRPFITHEREGAFNHYLDHIEHAIKIAGAEHVGIGSDRDHRVIEYSDEYIAELKAEEGANFNEDEWPLFMDELNGPGRMEVVWNGLKKRGLSELVIEQVMGGNVYRVYSEVIN